MPRQPYLKLVPNPRGAMIDVGTKSIGRRPELETLVGNCLFAWPHIEAEMALVLGQLLGAENSAALAVFQALRRSSSQRDAISEAAKVSLNNVDQELLTAILNVHKAIEAERNALTHGHFGTSTKVTDGLIWMNTNDYVAVRASMTLARIPQWGDEKQLKLLSSLSVYREDDLKTIFEDMKNLAELWHNFIIYLQTPLNSQPRADKYRQLCDQSHIARELTKLRREKTPPTPSE